MRTVGNIFFVSLTVVLMIYAGLHRMDTKQSTFSKLNVTRDLHPAGLRVMDISNFSFIINNDICGESLISLVTLVSSGVGHKV